MQSFPWWEVGGEGMRVGGGRGRELREIRDSPCLTRITLPFVLFCFYNEVIATQNSHLAQLKQ